MWFRKGVIVAVATVVMGMAAAAPPAQAQDQKVLVTVNDLPITSYDVSQRVNIWKLLGDPAANKDGARKRALNELIDDIAKMEEAKKSGMAPSEKDVDARIAEVAKGMKTDDAGLKGKLRKQGVTVSAMRSYFGGQIAFARLLRGKFNVEVKASPDEVDRKLAGYKAEIDGKVRDYLAQPGMQPVTVYELLEVNFPVEGEVTNELLQSRAIEANQYISRFKGCGSARGAASGIFNVKVGRKIEADGRRLPKPMKTVLDKTKAGRAIGPMRSPKGLQVIGFCGIRKIVPPKPKVAYPTRKQAEAAVLNEKYADVVSKYSSRFRKGLLIEYRDPAYGP